MNVLPKHTMAFPADEEQTGSAPPPAHRPGPRGAPALTLGLRVFAQRPQRLAVPVPFHVQIDDLQRDGKGRDGRGGRAAPSRQPDRASPAAAPPARPRPAPPPRPGSAARRPDPAPWRPAPLRPFSAPRRAAAAAAFGSSAEGGRAPPCGRCGKRPSGSTGGAAGRPRGPAAPGAARGCGGAVRLGVGVRFCPGGRGSQTRGLICRLPVWSRGLGSVIPSISGCSAVLRLRGAELCE